MSGLRIFVTGLEILVLLFVKILFIVVYGSLGILSPVSLWSRLRTETNAPLRLAPVPEYQKSLPILYSILSPKLRP